MCHERDVEANFRNKRGTVLRPDHLKQDYTPQILIIITKKNFVVDLNFFFVALSTCVKPHNNGIFPSLMETHGGTETGNFF